MNNRTTANVQRIHKDLERGDEGRNSRLLNCSDRERKGGEKKMAENS